MYWLRLPWNWGRQVLRNGSDILRVLAILRLRPLPAGLVSEEHPWVTGLNPATGIPVWFDNVIYRSPRTDSESLATDEQVLLANGRFLALRVRQSAVLPEVPQGAGRRMPHCINYMHGSSHYNSGLILLNDIVDAYRHVNDGRFRLELCRFVREERREVLFCCGVASMSRVIWRSCRAVCGVIFTGFAIRTDRVRACCGAIRLLFPL